MANVMSMKNVKNKPSRSGFDLSTRRLMTAKVSELLPAYCKELIPGDSVEIDLKWLTRTAPVQTAAFTRIREYYDFFFVPTNLLWDKFQPFIAQTNDMQTATSINAQSVVGDQHPYLVSQEISGWLYRMNEEFNTANIFGYQRNILCAKLLEYLRYGRFYYQDKTLNSGFLPPRENVALNPFPLLAYQKIYQDYYRNSQWESSAPWTYNLNYINSTNASSLKIDIDSIDTTYETMFDLRYANWNKDYFMGLLPNSQFGDEASLIVNPSSIDQKIMSLSNENSLGVTDKYLTNGATYRWALQNSDYTSFTSRFSILALRQAEAMQKWKEVTQASQKDYKSQMEAHFGVTMSDAYSDRCKFIDGIVQTLDISEQPNTNITGDNVATIAGKGVGTGQGKIRFKTDVHGYIMCIYHAVPLMDYSITGIARQNMKTRVTDYAIPEFDRTGMVQVPLVELSNNPLLDESVDIPEGNLLGYAPRYIDYKTDYDDVQGNFLYSDKSWIAGFDDEYINNYIAEWYNTVTSGGTGISLNWVFFKVNPSILDKIFGVDANAKYDTDQLKINVFFDVKATRNLDYDGLPY